MKKYRILGIALIILGLLLSLFILYYNSKKRQEAIIFSPRLMLSALWDAYKKQYWEESTGRTLDKQRNNITTSEGQSYTMLRAVWQDDKVTFDKAWEWTQNNLQRQDDNLFSWLYGQRADGSYGLLTDQGGQNSATDADTDIALALIFASFRWQDPTYLSQAQAIISDVWNEEVVEIKGQPYLTANNVEKNSTTSVLINPSYLSPYAYKIFAKVDPAHNWEAVADTSYQILQQASVLKLDKPASSGLSPDWVTLNRSSLELSASTENSLTTNYGYDAMRVPFRMALDWQWFNEERAKSVLQNFQLLKDEWKNKKMLAATYSHDGQVILNNESPAIYGGNLGYFLLLQPEMATEIYKAKLESLYSPDIQSWKKPMGYYDDNWAWFGLGLYHQSLHNLFTQ